MFHCLFQSTQNQFAQTYINIITPSVDNIPNLIQTTVQLFWQLRSSIIDKFNISIPLHSTFCSNNLQLTVRSKQSPLGIKVRKLQNINAEMMETHKMLARANILKHCKHHYHLRELEVITPASPEFYEQFTAKFHTFEPLKHKKFFTQYKRTFDMDSIHQFLNVEALNRRFRMPNADQTGTYDLDITAEASESRPFIALYNPVYRQMLLSFHYFPFPRAADWRPKWCADIKNRTSVESVSLQVCLFMY